ncbi:phytase [Kineobactrum salinum]|uniref:Phytase n=1 Tax=Kineobactrum salinum TaxID=2708301 RepID=A0A6C0U4A2_9GAMM|nr:phytase [Kineobactrum salinum]QIB64274.1 phytase [Kineobactrum salinum]
MSRFNTVLLFSGLAFATLTACGEGSTEAPARKDGNNTGTAPGAGFVTVRPVVATEPVVTADDAADDPAIWVHPEDVSRSTLIGTNKKGGLYVYDLDGAVIQYLEDGRMNNVDLRYNFSLAGEQVDLVTASNRSTAGISIYRVEPSTGKLVDVADGIQSTGMPDTYGSCMYQQPETRATYVFVNDKSGLYRQWQLRDSGNGRVRAEPVRDFSVPSQPEGCAADDEYGVIYVGEENDALWQFSAAPGGGSEGKVIARIAGNPAVKDDFEGVALYYGENGEGYVLVSSQGNDSYAVYERGGEHQYLGSFVIGTNEALGIDGTSETDGIDVISTPLGDNFPYGLFVAQDGHNLMPAENQNYKAVPWEVIADELELEKHKGWDPRSAVLRH